MVEMWWRALCQPPSVADVQDLTFNLPGHSRAIMNYESYIRMKLDNVQQHDNMIN